MGLRAKGAKASCQPVQKRLQMPSQRSPTLVERQRCGPASFKFKQVAQGRDRPVLEPGCGRWRVVVAQGLQLRAANARALAISGCFEMRFSAGG